MQQKKKLNTLQKKKRNNNGITLENLKYPEDITQLVVKVFGFSSKPVENDIRLRESKRAIFRTANSLTGVYIHAFYCQPWQIPLKLTKNHKNQVFLSMEKPGLIMFTLKILAQNGQ